MPQQRVPKALAAKYEEICRLTDAFCAKHLDAEYAELSESIVVALCRKRPSPLTRGRANSWACGVVHALGMVNFLFDPDAPRHLPARQLYEGFGVSASSGGAKSRAVRSALSMGPLDPEWTLPSSMLDNPRVWMIMVDDLVVDVRDTPVEIQRAAYDQGLIPFVPSDPSYGDQA
jgi:hypothetical protein